ncbi:hypothetical protein L7F22_016403 [Adiantum nelumboides]|nr:hypothetical protein [Adiantum nelumboides]
MKVLLDFFCGKEDHNEMSFIDGDDAAFKEAPRGSINQENLTNEHIQKGAEKALILDGGQSTSIHPGKAYREVNIGPRRFTSSRDMLHFFNQLLHGWPLNLNINKYEHMMLEDLLKKGHLHFFEKAGTGITAFQVRINKAFDSRCFYVVTKDGSMNDFSYRKCGDSIISLPKNLKSKFGWEQNQKRDGCYNGDAHVLGSKCQHSKRKRDEHDFSLHRGQLVLVRNASVDSTCPVQVSHVRDGTAKRISFASRLHDALPLCQQSSGTVVCAPTEVRQLEQPVGSCETQLVVQGLCPSEDSSVARQESSDSETMTCVDDRHDDALRSFTDMPLPMSDSLSHGTSCVDVIARQTDACEPCMAMLIDTESVDEPDFKEPETDVLFYNASDMFEDDNILQTPMYAHYATSGGDARTVLDTGALLVEHESSTRLPLLRRLPEFDQHLEPVGIE